MKYSAIIFDFDGVILDLDPAALGGPEMAMAFDHLIKLRTYVDDNFSGRDWNLASAMVINGEAGSKYGIPFAMHLRSTYGNLGAKLPGFLRGCVATIA